MIGNFSLHQNWLILIKCLTTISLFLLRCCLSCWIFPIFSDYQQWQCFLLSHSFSSVSCPSYREVRSHHLFPPIITTSRVIQSHSTTTSRPEGSLYLCSFLCNSNVWFLTFPSYDERTSTWNINHISLDRHLWPTEYTQPFLFLFQIPCNCKFLLFSSWPALSMALLLSDQPQLRKPSCMNWFDTESPWGYIAVLNIVNE